eukprot:gene25920-biopygen17873
MSRGGCSRQES